MDILSKHLFTPVQTAGGARMRPGWPVIPLEMAGANKKAGSVCRYGGISTSPIPKVLDRGGYEHGYGGERRPSRGREEGRIEHHTPRHYKTPIYYLRKKSCGLEIRGDDGRRGTVS